MDRKMTDGRGIKRKEMMHHSQTSFEEQRSHHGVK
jgi:hypothetical protein